MYIFQFEFTIIHIKRLSTINKLDMRKKQSNIHPIFLHTKKTVRYRTNLYSLFMCTYFNLATIKSSFFLYN